MLHILITLASVAVYPPSGRGAVNLTNGDVARLRPGEFLNDTLIEFGLRYAPSSFSASLPQLSFRYWHEKLTGTNPELAKQVHVFNSFFYKKLSHKK